ncbi:MAG: LysR family transcriptional regulator [Rhodospirillales bacterium]
MPDQTEKNFSLRHLGTFAAVVQHGRIAAAGEDLRRSPSSISRSLAILEDKFERPLLNRSQDGLSPTPVGELVAARCRIIQQDLEDLRDMLVQGNGDAIRRNASVFQMHIDVSRLRAIVAVHDFGSVNRACQVLGVSQPAISTSIRQLETDLGVDLFQRTQTGMIATPAGVSATLCFKRVLSELRKTKDDVDSFDGVSSGVVCVGGLAYSRNALLPEAINRVLSHHPQIVMRTVEGPITSLIAGMLAGEIDVLICAEPNPTLLEGVSVEPIVRDPMGLFVSNKHPLAGRRKLKAKEVSSYPFILPPLGSVTRDLLDEVMTRNTGGPAQGAVETSSNSVIRYLLLHSEQISFRSIIEFDAEKPSGRIVPLDLEFELPARSICLLQRVGVKRTAAVNEFLDIARQIAETVRGE